MPKIARLFAVKTRTIETALQKLGITKEWDKRKITKDTLFQDKTVLEEKLRDGLNAAQIGKEFGVQTATITYWLDKHDIPYSKEAGYARMDRNQPLRRANKEARKAKKKADKIASQKYPGRGKGKVLSQKSKLKISLSNAVHNLRKPSPEEILATNIMTSNKMTFSQEVPIVFLDERNRFIAAYRVDFFFQKGNLNLHHPVVCSIDGVYFHKQLKNVKRDHLFNALATRSGLVLARMWDSEVSEVTSKGTSKVISLLEKCRTVEPALLRYQILKIDKRRAKSHEAKMEMKFFRGAKAIHHKLIVSDDDRKEILDLIDQGHYVDPDSALS